jgi:hypothetical protein
MQVDGAPQKATCCCPVHLGGKKKIHCFSALVDCAVQILPLAGNFDVSLIYPPALYEQGVCSD